MNDMHGWHGGFWLVSMYLVGFWGGWLAHRRAIEGEKKC